MLFFETYTKKEIKKSSLNQFFFYKTCIYILNVDTFQAMMGLRKKAKLVKANGVKLRV